MHWLGVGAELRRAAPRRYLYSARHLRGSAARTAAAPWLATPGPRHHMYGHTADCGRRLGRGLMTMMFVRKQEASAERNNERNVECGDKVAACGSMWGTSRPWQIYLLDGFL